jgi:DNA-binding transcriptional regulator YdaS (Cro superfamily)
MKNPVRKAVSFAGTEAELARLTKVSPQAINKAVRKGRASPELAERIERAIGGKVTKEVLVFGYQQKAA